MIQRETEVKNKVTAVALTDSVHNVWHQEADKIVREWMREEPTPQICETLDSSIIHRRKKTWQHREPGISPSDKGLAGWMRFYTWCPEGLQKLGLGAPNRHVMGGRGHVLGQDCKQDTWELAGFMRGVKAAAAAEGGFSSPFVEVPSGACFLPALPPNCCNWVSSSEPLDTSVESMLPDCPRVSA
ncbi:putative Protein FAM172A protein, partial [Naja naja]